MKDKTYTVTVEQEGDELILPLPPALLEEMGWEIGTVLQWIDNKNGTFSLKSKSSSQNT
jgi:hypothetical protein